MNLTSLPPILVRVLADPAVQADAAACRTRIDWVAGGPTGDPSARLTVWPGQPGGAHLVCRGTPALWAQALSPEPPVGYQSFGAMRRRPEEFQFEGEALHVMQALPFLERLLEAVRRPASPAPAAAPPRHFDSLPHLGGRYLPLAGEPATWVYSEECGPAQAPALLMLHTAGSDARQWHGLMAQDALRAHWRLLAFDLPAHGRSPLPAGEPNWAWRLDQDRYIDWILRYLDAMQLERVALMGCSMGAAIGLALLARHPDRFHGAVLLEAPFHSPGRRSPFLNHAEVHGARLSAAWVGALLSPSSPPSGRDHATWIYSQGAPSVYDGDLAFYSDQFDARHHTGAIDTARTPLWLLTGDYDYSATPDDSRRIADAIPGAHFQAMRGFGHFPMVENPDGLMAYLREPLQALHRHIRPTEGAPS